MASPSAIQRFFCRALTRPGLSATNKRAKRTSSISPNSNQKTHTSYIIPRANGSPAPLAPRGEGGRSAPRVESLPWPG